MDKDKDKDIDIERFLYGEGDRCLRPEKGHMLIAEPMLSESVFRRSAVLLLDVDKDQGHLGLVLNKPAGFTLRDIIPEWEGGENVPVFQGGPVDRTRLFMLHTLGDRFAGSQEVVHGLYVGGKIEDIMEYISDGHPEEGALRFFLGYSGWTRDQLQTEVLRNSWAVETNPEGPELLKGEGDEYWRRCVARLGDQYRSWLVVPPSVWMN